MVWSLCSKSLVSVILFITVFGGTPVLIYLSESEGYMASY